MLDPLRLRAQVAGFSPRDRGPVAHLPRGWARDSRSQRRSSAGQRTARRCVRRRHALATSRAPQPPRRDPGTAGRITASSRRMITQTRITTTNATTASPMPPRTDPMSRSTREGWQARLGSIPMAELPNPAELPASLTIRRGTDRVPCPPAGGARAPALRGHRDRRASSACSSARRSAGSSWPRR